MNTDPLVVRDVFASHYFLLAYLASLGTMQVAGERAARCKQLDEEAEALIEKARRITGGGGTFQEEVEKGRKKVVEKAAPGAGANTQKRFRDELNYLLDNYSPSNDNKIETLIDKWRRSGDPSYDPAIKLQYRKVRKKKASDDYAF